MSDQTPQKVTFDCFKCGKENFYPVVEGKAKNGATKIVKRCTTCGIENEVDLPDGWIAERKDEVTRGISKKD